jgi:hypothetical protein
VRSHSLRSLQEMMRGLSGQDVIAVLEATTREELLQMVAHAGFLKNTRLIVLLPDERAETFAFAHRLRPRYVSTPGENVQSLIAVFRRLLAKSRQAEDRDARPPYHGVPARVERNGGNGEFTDQQQGR